MRMTASWFRSLDLPHTRLWRDSTAPESGLPSDCHPDCIIVLEAVRMRPGEIEPRTRRWKKCVTLLDSKSPIQAPYKGLGAESGEKREPASDIDTAVVDSLKALDPEWPIREADVRADLPGVRIRASSGHCRHSPNGEVSATPYL
jgi:hypothetical protein